MTWHLLILLIPIPHIFAGVTVHDHLLISKKNVCMRAPPSDRQTRPGNGRPSVNQSRRIKVLSVGSVVHSGMKNDLTRAMMEWPLTLHRLSSAAPTFTSPTQIQPRSLLEGIFLRRAICWLFWNCKSKTDKSQNLLPSRPSAGPVGLVAVCTCSCEVQWALQVGSR